MWQRTLTAALALFLVASMARAQGYDRATVEEFQNKHQEGIELLTRAEERTKKGEKADADFQKAIDAFTRCTELIPESASAYYNNACAYSIWGKKNQAMEWLKQAVDHGFLDFGHMERDDDLDNIRDTGEYKALLADYRKQLIENAFYRVVRPAGFDSAKRYPVLVALHGNGQNAYDYSRSWRAFADEAQVLVVCPQATNAVEGSESRFVWGDYTAESVVRGVLDKVIESPRYQVDREQVYLAGFEVGAVHAMEIGLKNPKLFKGIIAVNGPVTPEALARWIDEAPAGANPVALVAAKRAPKPFLDAVGANLDSLAKTGRWVKRFDHDGLAEMPDDAGLLGGAYRYLVEKSAAEPPAAPPTPQKTEPPVKPQPTGEGVEEF